PMPGDGSNFRQWVKRCVAYNVMIKHGDQPADLDALNSLKMRSTEPKSAANDGPFMKLDDAVEINAEDDFVSKLLEDPISKIVRFITPGRQMLKTKRGYLGLGPATTVAGDEVWLIKGSRMPLILRNKKNMPVASGNAASVKGETHVLVGETYLHGVMYGEMLRKDTTGYFHPVVLI
ncbi:hypothetical protein LY76DRAFT_527713, partial [Colletotrichum caudatum]